jgi:hypothetical protein
MSWRCQGGNIDDVTGIRVLVTPMLCTASMLAIVMSELPSLTRVAAIHLQYILVLYSCFPPVYTLRQPAATRRAARDPIYPFQPLSRSRVQSPARSHCSPAPTSPPQITPSPKPATCDHISHLLLTKPLHNCCPSPLQATPLCIASHRIALHPLPARHNALPKKSQSFLSHSDPHSHCHILSLYLLATNT